MVNGCSCRGIANRASFVLRLESVRELPSSIQCGPRGLCQGLKHSEPRLSILASEFTAPEKWGRGLLLGAVASCL